ncbi:hypothetical protein [Chryseobacterium wanjuense]
MGINTPNPVATLEIVAKNGTGTSTNVDGVLIPRVDRQRAQSMIGVPTSTMIYVNSAANGSQIGTAINIDNPGYYYFDGNVWVKMGAETALKNIYTTNGSLTDNRTVTIADKTLTFNTTTVNGFNVAKTGVGYILSIDGENRRVGFGTTTPQNKIDMGSDHGGSSTSSPAGKKLAVYNTSTASSFYGLGVNSNTLQVHAGSANDGEPGMVLTTNGNVGIGAPVPNSSAVLDLNSVNKGFLPPRMTTAQRDAINPKVAGLTIYNTTLNCIQYWNTQDWKGKCDIATPPNPDLSSNCTGWRLPYKNNNESATGSVKGTSLTATFSNYGNVKHSNNDPNRCGISITPADIFWLGDDKSQNTKMKIKFDKGVSNFKVIQTGTHAAETFTFTLKYKGAAVSPTVTVSPTVGSCNSRFEITKPTSNQVRVRSLNNWNWMVDGEGIIYNIGGVWFDEIDITALETTNQQNGSSFNFCVGDVL